MEKTIKINGMHCKSCKALIESEVKDIKGVESVDVNLESEKAIISMSKDCTGEVLKCIKDMKYNTEVIE